MTVSTTPIGWTPIAEDYSAFDEAIASPLEILRNDPSVPRVYTAEIKRTGIHWDKVSNLGGNAWPLYGIAHDSKNRWMITDSHGRAYRSIDNAETWEVLSSAGTGESVTRMAHKDGVWVAGSPNFNLITSDFGDTWTIVSAPSSSTSGALSLVAGDPGFVAVRYKSVFSAIVEFSSNGSSWAVASVPASVVVTDVVWDVYASSFFAAAYHWDTFGTYSARLLVSQDGMNWANVSTSVSIPTWDGSLSVLATNDKGTLVVHNVKQTFVVSTPAEGVTSSATVQVLAAPPSALTYIGLKWHALSDLFYLFLTDHMYESADGVTWTQLTEVGGLPIKRFVDVKQSTGEVVGIGGSVFWGGETVSKMIPTPIRVATKRYTSGDLNFHARLENPANFTMQVGQDPIVGGESVASFGVVSLNNGDGLYDNRLADEWDGGLIEVRFGTADMAYEDFGIVYSGLVGEAVWDDQYINLSIKNNHKIFDSLVQPDTYDSTYNANIQGKAIPLGYGLVRNATPVLVSATADKYQVHDGPVQSFDHVLVAGASTAAYTADISTGTFTLNLSPGADQITCDFKGYNDVYGYSDNPNEIFKTVLLTKGSVTVSALDTDSFAYVSARRSSATAGLYLQGGETIKGVLDTLSLSMGAYWGVNRNNKIFIKLLQLPGTPFRSYGSEKIVSIQRIATAPIVWATAVSYQKIWTTQTDSELAGSVTADERSYLAEEYRTVRYGSYDLSAKHKLAREIVIFTVLDDLTSAVTVASVISDTYQVRKDTYVVVINELTHDVEIGQTIKIAHPRFELGSGKSFLLVGFTENIRAGTITMTLWG